MYACMVGIIAGIEFVMIIGALGALQVILEPHMLIVGNKKNVVAI